MKKQILTMTKFLVAILVTTLTTAAFAADWQVQVGETITVQSVVEETDSEQYDVELTYQWPEEYLVHSNGGEAPYTTSDDLVLQVVNSTEGQIVNIDVVDVNVTRNGQTVEGNIINEDGVLVIPSAVDIRLEIQGTIEIVNSTDTSSTEETQ